MREGKFNVGIGCLILKDGQVLLGKRHGSFGDGTYDCIGGHLELMESIENCLRREVREEAGIEIGDLRLLCVMNHPGLSPDQHYVSIAFTAEWKSGEPKVYEPEKRESWGWYDLADLPQPMFGPVLTQIEAYKTSRNFFDE